MGLPRRVRDLADEVQAGEVRLAVTGEQVPVRLLHLGADRDGPLEGAGALPSAAGAASTLPSACFGIAHAAESPATVARNARLLRPGVGGVFLLTSPTYVSRRWCRCRIAHVHRARGLLVRIPCAAQPLGLPAGLLRLDPLVDRRPARLRGAPRLGRRCHRPAQHVGEPLFSGLAVLELAALLRCRDRQAAVLQPGDEPLDGPLPEVLGDARARRHVEDELHAGVGGVDTLAAGTAGSGELPCELVRGDDDAAADVQGVVHVPRMTHPPRHLCGACRADGR